MSQSHFVFQKNDQIYVEGLHKDHLEVFDENEKIYAYDELIIKYINEEKEYILFKDFVITGFNLIASLFQKALANSLKINHLKFPKGIGYEWVVILHAIAEDEIEVEDRTSPYRL